MMDDHEACLKSIKAHARKFGFELNPDHATVMRVVCGLLKNKKKYGKYYCPCKVVTGAEDIDLANECPCYYHEMDIALDGKCHCNLYIRGR
jgi:ferredoxin-thioredoxin reductase catalytic subunit